MAVRSLGICKRQMSSEAGNPFAGDNPTPFNVKQGEVPACANLFYVGLHEQLHVYAMLHMRSAVGSTLLSEFRDTF